MDITQTASHRLRPFTLGHSTKSNSLNDIQAIAARSIIVSGSKFKTHFRTQLETKSLKQRAPRPFTLLVRGIHTGIYRQELQTIIGCLPHHLTPVYCYKADAATTSTKCKDCPTEKFHPALKMLPANWETLELKIREKELYRHGLFPHVTSGHLQPDGTFSTPKLKVNSNCRSKFNEAVCTDYSSASIDCFIISSNEPLFACSGKDVSWLKSLSNARLLQKDASLPPTPFVFYNMNGGRFSKPYYLEELFPGKSPDEINSLLKDWEEYARYSGFTTEAISQLTWHYPPHEICQRMIKWHSLICGDLKKTWHYDLELEKANTPEEAIKLIQKGANLNRIKHDHGSNTTVYSSLECRFLTRCILYGLDFSLFKAFVSAALEHGVTPCQVNIDSNWLDFDLTYIATLIEKGAKTTYLSTDNFRLTRKHTNEDIEALLKIHRHLSATGRKTRPPLEYLPEFITSLEDIKRIRHFFLCLNSLGIKLNKEDAARYISTVNSSSEPIKKGLLPDEQRLFDQCMQDITQLSHKNQQCPETALPLASTPPSALQPVISFGSMQPILKLFQRSPLTLTDKDDLYITAQEILAHYYLTPDGDTEIIKTLKSGQVDKHLMRKFHGCDHVLRCMVLGDALMESFKQHDAQYRRLLSKDPQLEQLILIAILMHDITAEIKNKSQEELNATREFRELTERSGFPQALIDKVAIALLNKNTDTMEPPISAPYVADSDQPEDIRMITRLVRLPDCMDITRVLSLPEEFPEPPQRSCPDTTFDFDRMDLGDLATTHPKLIDEVKTLLIGSERLASLSGGQTPSDSRQEPPFWEQHKLLDPYIHHDERRHWLAYSPSPLAAMDSVLDDIVRLQIAGTADIKIQSDLQLKQVPAPGFLSNREKLLIAADHFPHKLRPYVSNLKMRHSSGMDRLLGTLTQETLASEKARRELRERKISVDETACWRADTIDIARKRDKHPTPAPDDSDDDTNVYDYVKKLVFLDKKIP